MSGPWAACRHLATASSPAGKAVAPCRDPGSGTALLHPAHTAGGPRADTGQGRKAGAGAQQAHLPLVPMQQGRPLISQSTCRKPVWLLLACSVQICMGGANGGTCVGAGAHPPPFPNHSPLPVLTGHLVMSSGQMWAPLEAGSSQVLEAEVRGQNEGLWQPRPARPPASGPAGAQTTMLSPTVAAPPRSALGRTWGPGDTRPLTSASGPARTCPWGARYHLAT